jgi:mannose-1-phosphate guanylyltransferase
VDGHDRSLLQSTYDRAKQLTDSIYIVSEASHIEHVKQQLSDLPEDAFITEPGRRGTANCIVAALEFIGRNHYIRDVQGFVHSFRLADQVAKSEGRIVLVGVEPDYPATGFGYIEKGAVLDEDRQVFNVHSFKEKPNFNVAKSYIESGKYLWNCGYFVGSINTFNAKMTEFAPELADHYAQLSKAGAGKYNEVYLSFESVSIDYALIEKVDDLLVVPAAFDWMDLGSFGDMHKAVLSDESGNHVSGKVETEEVENSFIQNHEDKPIAVIGLDNVVVVNTPHGILVARKDLSQKVGDISKRFNA